MSDPGDHVPNFCTGPGCQNESFYPLCADCRKKMAAEVARRAAVAAHAKAHATLDGLLARGAAWLASRGWLG